MIAVVDATGLKSTYVSLVLNKKIPLEDMILICGHINLQHYHGQLDRVFHFLICDVTPGLMAPLPAGFDYADSLVI